MPSYGEGFLDYFQYALPAVVAANSGYEIYKHSKEKKPNKTAMIKNAIIGSLAIGDIYGRMNQLQHEVEQNIIPPEQARAEGRAILAEAGDQLGLLHDVEMFEAAPPPIDFGGPLTTMPRQSPQTTIARQSPLTTIARQQSTTTTPRQSPTTMALRQSPIDLGIPPPPPGPPPPGPPPPPPDFFAQRMPPPPPMMTTTIQRQPSPPTLTSEAPAARPAAMADLFRGITKGNQLKSRATAIPDEEIVPIRKKPMDMFDAIRLIGEENKAKSKSGLSIEEQVKAAQELKKAELANKNVSFLSAALARRNRSQRTPTPTSEDENPAAWAVAELTDEEKARLRAVIQADQDAAQAERQGQLLIQAEEDARRASERGTKKAGPKTLPKKGRGMKGLKELIEEHARIVAELKPLTKEYKIQKKELEKYRRKKY